MLLSSIAALLLRRLHPSSERWWLEPLAEGEASAQAAKAAGLFGQLRLPALPQVLLALLGVLAAPDERPLQPDIPAAGALPAHDGHPAGSGAAPPAAAAARSFLHGAAATRPDSVQLQLQRHPDTLQPAGHAAGPDGAHSVDTELQHAAAAGAGPKPEPLHGPCHGRHPAQLPDFHSRLPVHLFACCPDFAAPGANQHDGLRHRERPLRPAHVPDTARPPESDPSWPSGLLASSQLLCGRR